MAVLYTFREPSLGRQMHRELMRNALRDLTTIMPATTYHRRSYADRYSRSIAPHRYSDTRDSARTHEPLSFSLPSQEWWCMCPDEIRGSTAFKHHRVDERWRSTWYLPRPRGQVPVSTTSFYVNGTPLCLTRPDRRSAG